MRLKDKIAIVVGAGQSPGEGMGNGRATVMAADRDLASAEETVGCLDSQPGALTTAHWEMGTRS